MNAGVKITGSFLRRLRWLRDIVLRRFSPRIKNGPPAMSSRYPPNEKLRVLADFQPLGHRFDEGLLRLEAAAKAHRPKQNWGPEYDTVQAAFDPLFYLSQHEDIRAQTLDPVGHYLRAGAREGRDPTPWFSTAEYRRAYLDNGSLGCQDINPFYHYLTIGRAAGNSPRAPANYKVFCRELGMTEAETTTLVAQRMADVRARLTHGTLGDMVMKAADLDPLIAQSWKAGLKVRVPPASNAIGVRRIGHLIDLQAQASCRRARAVIVVERAQLVGQDASIACVLDTVFAGVGADDTVVIVTDGGPRGWQSSDGLRVIDFRAKMPRAKDYKAGRTLIEFIRSLRPNIVINLNAVIMNRALRGQGRAVAADSVVYQYLPQKDLTSRARAVLGGRYYRAIDLQQRVIVTTHVVRDYLTEAFALPEAHQALIWAAQDPDDPRAYCFDTKGGGDDGGN